MYRLSQIIFLLFGLSISLVAQNPHGADFKMDCASCHTSEGWEIASDFWKNNTPSAPIISKTTGKELPFSKSKGFDHNRTEFALQDQHALVNCKGCHQSLVFSDASTECISCHTDMHRQTLGSDCARCHSSENWLVNDISQLHYENGFPLVGAHAISSCNDCHISETDLTFYPIGNECINCHLDDYSATTKPNHSSAGFSTNCIECHNINGFDWSTENINHDFFPLNKGHEIEDCAKCHTTGDYSNTPTECLSCHQVDYNTSVNPNHQNLSFPTDCIACHTTDPGWTPAKYLNHDSDFFPIYSGEHNGEWDQCLDCHSNPSVYAEVTCTTCHASEETGREHNGIGGYSYNSPACLACHPNGDANDNFDHNMTNFQLTGVHTTTECIECHQAGYAGTPTDCASCHTTDFNQATNPNHNTLGLSTDCASCHTTEPEWNPAAFDNHNEYYALNGAHATIANDCATCHNGDYSNTPNTCVGCHLEDFNATTDPNHTALQFSTECATCHSESAWEPATLDHNLTNFPLTGVHTTTACLECHTTGYAGIPTDCASCHTTDFNQTVNPNHNVLGMSTDCASCHTTDPDWNPAAFDSHNEYYVLNGAHATIANDCATCHNGDYTNTPNTCVGCHLEDYNATTDPNHTVLQFSTDCVICHSENAWDPATLDHNLTDFPLTGAHMGTACLECHAAGYVGTPTECASCHTMDFNQTTNPNHNTLGLSNDCASCHTTEPEWNPAAFANHNDYYALNGAHATIATDCATCHNGGYNNTPNTCVGCHQNDFNGTTDPNHVDLQFSTDCVICHSENAWDPATLDHNMTDFPLTGAHVTTECIKCHATGYVGTPTECASCHTTDFNQTTNPNHNTLGLSNDCASCHTTEPEWNPAAFANHNDYYALNGAHATIATDCATCHNGDYNNTPNTCVGCHLSDYNNTNNPNHSSAQFPTDCESCHTESSWQPSTFDHDGQYFPIYSGKHREAWNQCVECHTISGNFSMFSCIDCHEHSNKSEIDNDHSEVQDYTYTSIGCFTCHPNGNN